MSSAIVLVVEDEVLILDLLETALRDAGYAVDTAIAATEALEFVAAREDTLAGLVTDVNLGPGHSGWDIAKAGRNINPLLPVVYLTGDSAHEYEVHGVPHSALVLKPFVGVDVVAALARLKAERDNAPKAG